MTTGHSQAWDTGASIGEGVFVPSDGCGRGTGRLRHDLARSVRSDRSWLYIWDAGDFPCPPMALGPDRISVTALMRPVSCFAAGGVPSVVAGIIRSRQRAIDLEMNDR